MITYTTPSSRLLTATPDSSGATIPGSELVSFLGAAGIGTQLVSEQVAPQVVRYDLRLNDIFRFNRASLKKALELFGMRHHCSASLGSSACGDFSVTVTRTTRGDLYLKSAILKASFVESNRTTLTAGLDTNGIGVTIDMVTAPHVLIAGTTGSGKSVLLNSMICSLLYKQTPATGRIMMIDPKQVELTAYSKLPHLIRPIVTDASEAVSALEEVCSVMENRYKALAKIGAKNLSEVPTMFPRWYIIIDELADLMLVSKKKVEASIVRIAQLGRAAGIHLIIATQRPTVNVITGLIKANIPTKICLTMTNTTDSITMLGHGGAEKLTGRGDAIIKTPDSVTERRFQAAYTPNEDIANIVKWYCGDGVQRTEPERKTWWR